MYVSYQQVSIFDPALVNPFNNWLEEHVTQGFSWRPSSVAFGTLDPDGEIDLEINSDTKVKPCKEIIRAIAVPFTPPLNLLLELATITERHRLQAPDNTTGILFEAGLDGARNRYRITFLRGDAPEPAILVADQDLTVPKEFLMETESA